MDVTALAPTLRAARVVAAAWVFGSAARGELREDSDVDVAVLLDDPADTALDHRRALMDLAARLELVAGRCIDLVVLGLHDPILAHRVLCEGIRLLDRDPARRVAFEADVTARYFDWAPRFEAAERASLAANRAWARGDS